MERSKRDRWEGINHFDEWDMELFSAIRALWADVEPFREKTPIPIFRHAVLELLFLWSQDRGEIDSSVQMGDSAGSNSKNDRLEIPSAAQWETVVAAAKIGKAREGVERAFEALAEANPGLSEFPFRACVSEAVDLLSLARLAEYLDTLDSEGETCIAARYLGQVYALWLHQFTPKADDLQAAAELDQVDVRDHLTKILGTDQLRRADIEIYLNDLVAFAGKAKTQDDITSLGPLYYQQPKGKPFFLTPKTNFLQRQARVGFDGKNYLIVWLEDHYTKGEWLMGCRVTPTGTVLDPGGFVIHKWGDHIQIRLASGKDPKTGKPVFLVVWNDQTGPYAQVRGALIQTSGTPKIIGHVRTPSLSGILSGSKAINGRGIPIFPDIDYHVNPWMEYDALTDYIYQDVAFNGTDFVVTCVTGSEVVARLVSPQNGGVKVEKPLQTNVVYPWGKPVTLKLRSGTKSSAYGLTATKIVSDGGSSCLVTWHKLMQPGNSYLYGVRLDFSGSSCKIGTPKTISKHLEPPYGWCAMSAGTGNKFLLSFVDRRRYAQLKKAGGPSVAVYPDLALAVTKPVHGKPTDFNVSASPLIFAAKKQNYYPEASFDGANHLVVWNSATKDIVNFHPQLGCLVGIVVGSYVTPDGKIIESFFVKDEKGGNIGMGDVCFGKNEGLLVYEHHDSDPWNVPSSRRKLRLRFLAKTP